MNKDVIKDFDVNVERKLNNINKNLERFTNTDSKKLSFKVPTDELKKSIVNIEAENNKLKKAIGRNTKSIQRKNNEILDRFIINGKDTTIMAMARATIDSEKALQLINSKIREMSKNAQIGSSEVKSLLERISDRINRYEKMSLQVAELRKEAQKTNSVKTKLHIENLGEWMYSRKDVFMPNKNFNDLVLDDASFEEIVRAFNEKKQRIKDLIRGDVQTQLANKQTINLKQKIEYNNLKNAVKTNAKRVPNNSNTNKVSTNTNAKKVSEKKAEIKQKGNSKLIKNKH